jgi:PAS domain-containing protein
MARSEQTAPPQTALPPAASEVFGEYGPAVTAACAVILLAAIVSIDKLTGFDLRLSILYLLPVAIVTWTGGRVWGAAMAVASAATWLVLFWTSNHYMLGRLLFYWDTAALLITLLIFVVLLARLRDELRASDARFVKVLENLDAAVYVADPERAEVLYGNKQFRATRGQNPYDVLARYPAKECRMRWPDGRRVVLRILTER